MGKTSRAFELVAIFLLLVIGISMVNAYFLNRNVNDRRTRRIVERNVIFSPRVGQPRGRRQY